MRIQGLLFIIIVSSVILACNSASEEESFEELISESFKLNKEERLKKTYEALEYAQNENLEDKEARAIYFLGYFEENYRNYRKADSLYTEAIIRAKEAKANTIQLSGMINRSMVNIYMRNLELAEEIIHYGIALAEKHDDKRSLAFLYYAMATLEDRRSQYPSSIRNFQLAQQYFSDVEENTLAVRCLNYLGIQYSKIGAYEESSQFYLEAAEQSIQLRDTSNYVSALYQSAIILNKNKDYETAIDLEKKAEQITYVFPDSSKLSRIYNNLAESYYGMALKNNQANLLDSATLYASSSLFIKEDLNDKYGLPFTQLNLGKFYMAKAEHDSSQKYLNLALNRWVGDKDTLNMLRVKTQLLKLAIELDKDVNRSILEISNLFSQYGNYTDYLEFADSSLEYYQSIGEWSKYAVLLQKRDSTQAIHLKEEKLKSVAATEARLNSIELGFQNEELRIENQYQSEAAELRKWLLVVVLVVLLVSIFLTLAIRTKNQKLSHLNSTIRVMKDSIVHGQSNNAAMAIALIKREMDSRGQIDGDTALVKLQNIFRVSRLLYASQQEFEVGTDRIELSEVLSEIIIDFQKVNQEVQINSDLGSVISDSSKCMQVGLILDELLKNSLKYARNLSSIEIRLVGKPKAFTLFYTDDGDESSVILEDPKIIEDLVNNLRGKYKIWYEEGLNYEIDIPNT